MDVLHALFGDLVIPLAVRDELTAKSELFPNAAQVPVRPWIFLLAPADQLLVKGLANRGHRGEAECLAPALEHPDSLLLLDDLAAREIARRTDCSAPEPLVVWRKPGNRGCFPPSHRCCANFVPKPGSRFTTARSSESCGTLVSDDRRPVLGSSAPSTPAPPRPASVSAPPPLWCALCSPRLR